MKTRERNGNYSLTTIDQFGDQLLREDRIFGCILPRIP